MLSTGEFDERSASGDGMSSLGLVSSNDACCASNTATSSALDISGIFKQCMLPLDAMIRLWRESNTSAHPYDPSADQMLESPTRTPWPSKTLFK